MKKNILITGGGGFIGSHLVERCVTLGHKVKVLSPYNIDSSWGWMDTFDKNIKDNIEVILGDVNDFNLIKKKTKKTDVIFHLAALISIPYSYQSPKSYIDTNINGTYNILEASKENDVELVVNTSTSEVYGSAQYIPIDENHPMNAQSPYAATKIAADHLCLSYYRSFNLPVTVLRPFNTFGPRQSLRAVIPTIISQFATISKSASNNMSQLINDFGESNQNIKDYFFLEVFGNLEDELKRFMVQTSFLEMFCSNFNFSYSSLANLRRFIYFSS